MKALTLGSPCPDFDLPGTDGKHHSLASFAGAELLVVVVSCNHCPYVIAWEDRMLRVSREYGPKAVQLVAINGNDAEVYRQDDMAHMIERVRERGFDFPYLRDDSQEVVRALGARVTPEVYVFDRARRLRYHGRIDDNHRDAAQVRSPDLVRALDALLAGQEPPVAETQAVGCTVKWK